METLVKKLSIEEMEKTTAGATTFSYAYTGSLLGAVAAWILAPFVWLGAIADAFTGGSVLTLL